MSFVKGQRSKPGSCELRNEDGVKDRRQCLELAKNESFKLHSRRWRFNPTIYNVVNATGDEDVQSSLRTIASEETSNPWLVLGERERQ